MKRHEDLPLSKHTLNLYRGEYGRLQEAYPRIGAGKIIRTLVHRHLRELDQQRDTVDTLPLDLRRIIEEEAETGPAISEL